MKKIFVLTGEPSGDKLASTAILKLQKDNKDINYLSVGGENLKKIGIKCPSPEGRPQCDWIIVDVGSVLVHLFRQETRDLYNLEKLWEINFESSETKLA